MTARRTGLLVLGIHLALIFAVAAKYELDLKTLPRAWAPVEWNRPVSGGERYIVLQPCPLYVPVNNGYTFPVKLRAVSGVLTADPGTQSDRVQVTWSAGRKACVRDSVEFYLPEGLSLPPSGSELWAEFSIPSNELPRPLRLGTKENGHIAELTR